jgi:hypothetical protein
MIRSWEPIRTLLLLTWLAWPAGPGRTKAAQPPVPVPISAETWTEAVGFQPAVCTPCQGVSKVTKANAAAFAGWLPEGVAGWIERYGLELQLVDYRPVRPSDAYILATAANRGTAKIVEIGDAVDRRGITGYLAGLPFPQPATGLEVAWNFHYAYGGDDAEVTYEVFWVQATAGVEHTELWKLSMIRATNRTDLEPIPNIESMASKGLQGAGLTYALAPYDKKGFGAVYYKSVEPRDGQGHTYVPAMRRVIKNSFGTRGDTWNATDLLFEDVRGYAGYPEWMHWRLLDKTTVLLPMHSGVPLGKKGAKKAYDFQRPPHWNPRYSWEPRSVYVLEAKPKLPDYPYSRQVFYVDAESSAILYKLAFDRKGAAWKVLINSASPHAGAESDTSSLGWSGTVVVDLQAEHATVFHVHKARRNIGLEPELFTVSSLRKRSR